MTRKLGASAADAGQLLGAWLAARLRIPAAEAAGLVAGGSVYVAGRRVRDAARLLAAGERIVVHDPGSPSRGAWRMVYLDDAVLVVAKDAGLASQATREAGGALDEQVAARYPGARLLHRLDREASGLVMFTLSSAAQKRFAAALARGEVEREYFAVVAGHPGEDTFVVEAPIGRDPIDHRRRRAGVEGGESARTLIQVLLRGLDAAGQPIAELRVTLDTGRTHQIRVHLASVGHPLLGDPLYAPAEVRDASARLALHAVRLAWPGGEAEAPVPEELASLRRR